MELDTLAAIESSIKQELTQYDFVAKTQGGD